MNLWQRFGNWKIDQLVKLAGWEKKLAVRAAEATYPKMKNGEYVLAGFRVGVRMGQEKLDELIERERAAQRYSLLAVYRDYYRWLYESRDEIAQAGANAVMERMFVSQENIWVN